MGDQERPVLIVCPTATHEQVTKSLMHGASGYLVENDFTSNTLLNAVTSAAQRHTHLSPAARAALMRETTFPTEFMHAGKLTRDALTPREQDVMDLLSLGFNASEIGKQLFLTSKTVYNYLANIYRKLGVSSRVSAVLLWVNSGAVKVR
ncbi:response regulator transcription factor [Streptomyces spongiae]|nr:response regulator transcription factor [Streptomyces spongiae]